VVIKEEFIKKWETACENQLAFEYGGYIYVPYIMAHSISVTTSGRVTLNRLINDSRWGLVNLGNVDGVGAPAAEG